MRQVAPLSSAPSSARESAPLEVVDGKELKQHVAAGGPRDAPPRSPGSSNKRGRRASFADKLEALVMDAERKRRASLREKATGLRAVFSGALRRELHELNEEQRERHLGLVQQFQLRRFDDIDTMDKVTERREREQLKDTRWLLSPHTTFVRGWELAVMVLVCWQALWIPFVLSYAPDEVIESPGWKAAEATIDGLFLLDVCLRFNIALILPAKSFQESTTVVTDRRRIAVTYLQTWFLVDLVSSLPMDQVVSLARSGHGGSDLQALGLLRALRLVKLLRLFRLLRLSAHFTRWLQFSKSANLIRLVRLLLVIVILTHYMACVWEAVIRDSPWDDAHLGPSAHTFERYITGFYVCLLLFLGSDPGPVTDSEKWFSSVAIFMGAVILAIVFGNVAILIRNYTANATNYQTKMTALFETMTHLGLPTPLQERIERYYQYLWSAHHTLSGNLKSFLPELSSNLRSEVLLYQRTDLVRRTPFFRYCSADVVQALVLAMELHVFLPNDYVIKMGEIGTCMYFLQEGRVFVTIPDADAKPPGSREKTVKHLDTGSFFGDVGLLFDVKRTASVRAEDYCQICVLTRASFQGIADEHAEVRDIVTQAMQDANYEQVSRDDEMLYSPTVQGRSLSQDENFVTLLVDKLEAAERREEEARLVLNRRLARLEAALASASSSSAPTATAPTAALPAAVSPPTVLCVGGDEEEKSEMGLFIPSPRKLSRTRSANAEKNRAPGSLGKEVRRMRRRASVTATLPREDESWIEGLVAGSEPAAELPEASPLFHDSAAVRRAATKARASAAFGYGI